jgi:hypothetical protein
MDHQLVLHHHHPLVVRAELQEQNYCCLQPVFNQIILQKKNGC